MPETYNIYCDESCHLEHDGLSVMGLGAVWCPTSCSREISSRVHEIKSKHGLSPTFEVKWTKVSPAKGELYRDLVDYFFDDDDLHFRGILIPDKSVLDHSAFNQRHDDWYYKMLFTLLEVILVPGEHFRVYIDIKDTRSAEKSRRLQEVLRNAKYDFHGQLVERVQPIRSEESQLLQLADLLIGAVCYHNRRLATNAGKLSVVERIRQRSHKSLEASTWLRESKFNLLHWRSERTS